MVKKWKSLIPVSSLDLGLNGSSKAIILKDVVH